jgi:hypothetical protein
MNGTQTDPAPCRTARFVSQTVLLALLILLVAFSGAVWASDSQLATPLETSSADGSLASQVTATLPAGWNLVAGAAGSNTSGATVFGFSGGSYQSSTAANMQAGKGYWVRFAAPTSVTLTTVPAPFTVPLSAGWNLIGNATSGAAVLPQGKTAFVFEGARYLSRTTLESGQGAWVRAIGNETLVLSPSTDILTVSDAITTPYQQNTHTFAGTAGQIVYLDSTTPSGSNLRWELFGPSGNSLGANWMTVDLGRKVLAVSGTYTIKVWSGSATNPATGSYSFTVLAVPPDSTSSISIGAPVTGEITVAGQHKFHTFTGTANQIVYLDSTTPSGSNLRWELFGPSGNSLGANWMTVDLGRKVLAVSGTYTIKVWSGGDNNPATGSYSFTVLAVPPDSTSSISIGAPVTGEITVAGQHKFHTFTGTANQIVYLHSTTPSGSNLRWELFGPSGNSLGANWMTVDLGRKVLAVSGTYTIKVWSGGDNNPATGSYSFVVNPSS